MAQSAGVAEYIDSIFAEGLDFPNKCPGYDTKQSDGEASVMQEFGEMRSIPLLPSQPGFLWLGLVAPYRVLSMSQIEINCAKLNCLKLNSWTFQECVNKWLMFNWIVSDK